MKNILAIAALLCALAACADASQNWPNLASVPERPKEFSTPQARQELKQRLEQDRLDAGQVQMDLSPPLPLEPTPAE